MRSRTFTPAIVDGSGRPVPGDTALIESRRERDSWLRGHSLAGFFVLAYAFSWSAVFGLAARGVPAAVVIGVATVGPTFGAVVMTALLEGRAGLTRLPRRIHLWNVGVRWYLVALLGIPLVYLIGTLVLPSSHGAFHPALLAPWLVQYVLVFVAGGIVGGPFFEEPGWRGFALPRLQAGLGPLRGTLLLGVLWGAWHLPQFFVPAWADQNGGLHWSTVGVFLLVVVEFTVVLSWIFNHTRGSLLLVMLAHASLNTAQLMVVNQLFPSLSNTEVNALIGFGAAAVLLIVVTRGRLGYRSTPTDVGR